MREEQRAHKVDGVRLHEQPRVAVVEGELRQRRQADAAQAQPLVEQLALALLTGVCGGRWRGGRSCRAVPAPALCRCARVLLLLSASRI